MTKFVIFSDQNGFVSEMNKLCLANVNFPIHTYCRRYLLLLNDSIKFANSDDDLLSVNISAWRLSDQFHSFRSNLNKNKTPVQSRFGAVCDYNLNCYNNESNI